MESPEHCTLCPRACGANRTMEKGYCGAGAAPKVARAAAHLWEEPSISGSRGSGTVFFSGCPLKCCFCQNNSISIGNYGVEVTPERLGEIFLSLQAQKVHNLNLVSAGQYLPQAAEALRLIKSELRIPVVYNTGGYERTDALKLLEGLVEVYLPDLKYFAPEVGARYAGAPDYFAVASAAILEMYRQVGPIQMDGEGLLRRGLVVRHLVLPGNSGDSREILLWLSQNLPAGEFLLSLMRQFTPDPDSPHKELRRRVATGEYRPLAELAAELGFSGYIQERESAAGSYIPDFNLEGVTLV